jgi:hypothetical protein
VDTRTPASFAAPLVGCGIQPSSLVEDAALEDRIQRLTPALASQETWRAPQA